MTCKEEDAMTNPALIEALARDRAAELRGSAAVHASRIRPNRHRHRLLQAARRGTGWMLIDVGLRLVARRGPLDRPAPR
jgi:hypothetical protein